jgi:hypothetical protein
VLLYSICLGSPISFMVKIAFLSQVHVCVKYNLDRINSIKIMAIRMKEYAGD